MSDKTEREYRQNMLTILDRFYRGRGGSLLTKDECEAMEYAISSIKTDLKYDLLYEGEDELCTGDCDNCAFVDGDYCRVHEKSIPANLYITEIKKHQSDFSDLQQEPNSDIRFNGVKNELNRVKNELEPTTKNDLGVDLISKSDVDRIIDCPYFRQADKLIQIMNLPSVTFKDPCDTCRHYENGCHWLPSVTPQEPKTGHWKLVQRGKEIDVCCSNCGAVRIKGYAYNYTIDELNKEDINECCGSAEMRYCPNCGSRNEVEE